MIAWHEDLPGEKWHADHEGRRATVLTRYALDGERLGVWWWIDGGEHHTAASPAEAKAIAEQDLLRGLGGAHEGMTSGDGPEVGRAEPAQGPTIAHGETCALLALDAADIGPTGRAEPAQGAADDLPFEPTGHASRPLPASLAARLADNGQVAREWAERVESYAAAVRELVAGEEVDADLAATLQREASEAAHDLAEAGVEVIRELRRDLAVAEAIRAHYRAQAAAASDRAGALEAKIEWITETVLRRCCEAAGKDKTRRLDLTTARVSIKLNRASVSIAPGLDPRLLPEQFQRVEVEADKKAIAAALKAGEKVAGCELVQSDRVEVE